MSASTQNKAGHAGHNPILDGIRGMAILLVMLHHFFMGVAPASTVDRFALAVTESGWCGVDLFFVLSGFLITGILYDTKQKKGYFKNFYARRTLRIFPLYYAVLVLFFVVFPLLPVEAAREYVSGSSADQVWFWTYLTNFRIIERGGFYPYLIPSVFWSLAIEEQFYLAWPLIIRVLRQKQAMFLCAAIVLLALGLRVTLAAMDVSPIAGFVMTFARLDCLAVGAFLALLSRSAVGIVAAVPVARVVAWVAALALLTISFSMGSLKWTDPVTNTVGLTALALFFGSILTLAVAGPEKSFLRTVFDNRGLRILGKYSYALYIFHGPAGTVAKRVFDPTGGSTLLGSSTLPVVAYALVASVISLIAAIASWNLLEKHFLRFKDRFQSA